MDGRRLTVGVVTTLALFLPPCDRGGDHGVALSLDRGVASPGQTLELTIENRTRWRLEYGVSYKLERREDGRWRWVNRDQAFILLLKFIEPGEREREEIRLARDLRPGDYRVVKFFTAPAPDRELRAGVEFRVI